MASLCAASWGERVRWTCCISGLVWAPERLLNTVPTRRRRLPERSRATTVLSKVGAAVAAAEALAEVRMRAARDAFGSLEVDLLERERGAIAAAALEVEARRSAEQLREAAETQLTAARREAALAAAEAAKAAEALRTERSTRAKAQASIAEMQRMTRDATRAAERAVLAESGLREEAAGLRRRLAEAMAALAAAKRAQPPPS